MTTSLTSRVLHSATDFADQFTGDSKSAVYPRRVTNNTEHFHYHVHRYYTDWTPYSWYFWPPVQYNYYTIYQPKSEPKESENESSVSKPLIVALATGAFLVGSFFLGKDLANWQQAKKHKTALEADRETLLLNRVSVCNRVIRKQQDMLDQIEHNALTGVVTKTMLVASALLAGIGGVVGAGPILTLGLISSAVTAGFMLLRWGYTDANQILKEDALELRSLIAEARAQNTLSSGKINSQT